MSITYRNVSSDTHSLVIKTVNYDLTPDRRSSSEEVIGRDGAYWFEDGFGVRYFAFLCTLTNSGDYATRRTKMHDIALWLSQPGELVMSAESTKKYNARVVKKIDAPPGAGADQFIIVFEAQPIAFPATATPATFASVTAPSTITVNNTGNYTAYPVITLTGTAATLTIADDNGNSFTYVNLSGTIYIDCKNKLVYSVSGGVKTNRRMNLTGNYLKLNTGNNTLDITGTITSLAITFNNHVAYL